MDKKYYLMMFIKIKTAYINNITLVNNIQKIDCNHEKNEL